MGDGRWKIGDVGQALPLAGVDWFGRRERLPYRILRRDIAVSGCGGVTGIACEFECFGFRFFTRQNPKEISWDACIRGVQQGFEKREAGYATKFFVPK